MLADGLRDEDAEGGEAVEDDNADVELGGLTVEVLGREPLAEKLHAVHLRLDAAAVVVAAPTLPHRAVEAPDSSQGFGPRPRAGAVLLPGFGGAPG